MNYLRDWISTCWSMQCQPYPTNQPCAEPQIYYLKDLDTLRNFYRHLKFKRECDRWVLFSTWLVTEIIDFLNQSLQGNTKTGNTHVEEGNVQEFYVCVNKFNVSIKTLIGYFEWLLINVYKGDMKIFTREKNEYKMSYFGVNICCSDFHIWWTFSIYGPIVNSSWYSISHWYQK